MSRTRFSHSWTSYKKWYRVDGNRRKRHFIRQHLQVADDQDEVLNKQKQCELFDKWNWS